MKKCLAPLFFLVLCSAAPAQALSFDVSYSISLHNADPGLVVWSDPLGGQLSFDLDATGDSFSTQQTSDPLFTLGTDETALNLDDIVPYEINVDFTFTSPDGLNGTANGITGAAWLGRSFGYVVWDNPLVLAFGNYGSLGISLTNATFGLPGTAPVHGTFTLLQADGGNGYPTRVPEPASGILLGLGAFTLAAKNRHFLSSRRAA
jgi:hypothetical protein